MTELDNLTASSVVALYQSGDLSPIEVTRATLDRINILNARFNAFCLIDEDRALADAKASEKRWKANKPQGLIDGVPATIKDLMLSKGWPTLRGSKHLKSTVHGKRTHHA